MPTPRAHGSVWKWAVSRPLDIHTPSKDGAEGKVNKQTHVKYLKTPPAGEQTNTHTLMTEFISALAELLLII